MAWENIKQRSFAGNLIGFKAKRRFAQGQRGNWFNRLLGSLLATMGVGAITAEVRTLKL